MQSNTLQLEGTCSDSDQTFLSCLDLLLKSQALTNCRIDFNYNPAFGQKMLKL